METITSLFQLQDLLTWDWTIIAQNVEDPDVLGQMKDAFTTFVESGKLSVLMIGIILGWFFRYFLRG